MNRVFQTKGISMDRSRIPAAVNQVSDHNTPGQVRKDRCNEAQVNTLSRERLVFSVYVVNFIPLETVIEQ